VKSLVIKQAILLVRYFDVKILFESKS